MLLSMDVIRVARAEALRSSLPGYYDEPADAVRHIVLAAELRRRAGLGVARMLWEGHELPDRFRTDRLASTAMDDANNRIGLAIGARARSYGEVVEMARASIRDGITNEGSGANDTPVWLPRSLWTDPQKRLAEPPTGPLVWQERALGDGVYAQGGPEHAFMAGLTPRGAEATLLRDLETVPPEAWSDQDVRAVIRSRPYHDSRDPSWGRSGSVRISRRRSRGRKKRLTASRPPDSQTTERTTAAAWWMSPPIPGVGKTVRSMFPPMCVLRPPTTSAWMSMRRTSEQVAITF